MTIAAIVSASRARSPEPRTRVRVRSSTRRVPQPVADRADRLDRRRASGKHQLAAQIADVDAEDVGPRVVLVAPDRGEDPLARDDPAAVTGEEREQLELGRRQRDLDPGPADPAPQEVDLDVARLERRR